MVTRTIIGNRKDFEVTFPSYGPRAHSQGARMTGVRPAHPESYRRVPA